MSPASPNSGVPAVHFPATGARAPLIWISRAGFTLRGPVVPAAGQEAEAVIELRSDPTGEAIGVRVTCAFVDRDGPDAAQTVSTWVFAGHEGMEDLSRALDEGALTAALQGESVPPRVERTAVRGARVDASPGGPSPRDPSRDPEAPDPKA